MTKEGPLDKEWRCDEAHEWVNQCIGSTQWEKGQFVWLGASTGNQTPKSKFMRKTSGTHQIWKSTLVIWPSLIWSTVSVNGWIELWLTVSYMKVRCTWSLKLEWWAQCIYTCRDYCLSNVIWRWWRHVIKKKADRGGYWLVWSMILGQDDWEQLIKWNA